MGGRIWSLCYRGESYEGSVDNTNRPPDTTPSPDPVPSRPSIRSQSQGDIHHRW